MTVIKTRLHSAVYCRHFGQIRQSWAKKFFGVVPRHLAGFAIYRAMQRTFGIIPSRSHNFMTGCVFILPFQPETCSW
jgi:hypothetical protein